jgi:hypothetical protein
MNDIFTSFLKGGIAVLFGVISGGGTETAIRAGVARFLKDFTASLPREIRESFISQATLAIIGAPDEAHVELQITGVLAEIEEWRKKHV